MRKWIVFVILGGLTLSCLDTPDCYNLNNSTVGISFRKLFDGKADTVALISLEADQTDSIFYPLRLVTGVTFPLDFTTDRTYLYFNRPGGTQQLTLNYRVQAQFVSEDCGERYLVSELGIEQSDFDSTRLVDGSITSNPRTNIIIYRCPITNLAKFSFRQLYPTKTDTIGQLLSLHVNGVYADFAGLVYPDTTASTYRLPVNPASNTTTFTFDMDEGPQDVTIAYQKSERALFTVCGPQTFYGSMEVTASDFPITKTLRDTLQDPPITNVIFQRCPDTNLMKLVFKKSTATNANNDTIQVNQITADYTAEIFYADTEVTTITLPLNPDADQTTFTLDLEDGVKDLVVSYTRKSTVYHEVCGTTVEMADLAVVSSDFLTTPVVKNTSIKFPTVTNLEAVND